MAIRLGCVCVAGADGAVRACGRAYARCEERWKVRMGIARNTGNGGKQKKKPLRWNECSGLRGADGSRNRDLFDANEALYQLSYSPMCVTLFSKTTLEILVRSVEKCNSTLRVLCLRCIRRYFYDD